MNLEVTPEVYAQVSSKRDEYVRLNEYGRSPVGKWPSKGKVVEYAIQLLFWMENHGDDPNVLGILSRFQYKSNIKRPGRPYSTVKTLNEINFQAMQNLVMMFKGMGIESPTDEQLIEAYNNAKLLGEPIGKKPKIAAEQARKKKEEIKSDPTLKTLDEATKPIPIKSFNHDRHSDNDS